MAALIRKARDVGSISDYDYKQLNIALSTAGYRTNEPVPLHEEFPTLVDHAIRQRLDDGDTSRTAAKALMTPGEFTAIYLESDR